MKDRCARFHLMQMRHIGTYPFLIFITFAAINNATTMERALALGNTEFLVPQLQSMNTIVASWDASAFTVLGHNEHCTFAFSGNLLLSYLILELLLHPLSVLSQSDVEQQTILSCEEIDSNHVCLLFQGCAGQPKDYLSEEKAFHHHFSVSTDVVRDQWSVFIIPQRSTASSVWNCDQSKQLSLLLPVNCPRKATNPGL